MSKYTVVNNDFVLAGEASVLITDLAVQRGYGIFDFFKIINGQPIFLEDHLDRFYHSAGQLRLPVAYNRDELKAVLFELMKKNGVSDSGIRITLTGGYSPDGYTVVKPNMIITQQPLTISKEINTQGIKVITHPHQRQMAHIKTIDYLMAIWLQPLIKEKGADDVLYHNNGMVKEVPRANFFIVTPNNEVLTSGTGVLKGIIRKQLLGLNGNGFNVQEREISLEEVMACKEAFITSSTKNILPVTEIDGHVIGNGGAGEVSKALSEKLTSLFN
ncbi:aminotransferase class IV [Mucilaginibacter sp. PAMB04274]|uniref:aminotransferase class IV n=1 Tax=Mucilaginibacter sp. PAMB04274 TaxID=3138568 RepID=UPI0031F609E7